MEAGHSGLPCVHGAHPADPAAGIETGGSSGDEEEEQLVLMIMQIISNFFQYHNDKTKTKSPNLSSLLFQ